MRIVIKSSFSMAVQTVYHDGIMSYDIPQHVEDGLRMMFAVADQEIIAMRKAEAGFRDKENSPAWGYVAQELTPMLRRIKGEFKTALENRDVMPAVAALQEKIDTFELDTRDTVKAIFVKATKAMLHHIDPSQYPEMEGLLNEMATVTSRS